ncbi:MAG TPA: hypothetical protein VMA34_17750 [Terracidiphilus sp.]|nr:hypothetical protein [Terracidiphilus sp.]
MVTATPNEKEVTVKHPDNMRPDFRLAYNVLILVNFMVRPERFELPTY